MFVIRLNEGHREYVSTSYPNWLNLLNGTTTKKEYATKFQTKKQADEFVGKLMQDGYSIAGSSVLDRFKVVRY